MMVTRTDGERGQAVVVSVVVLFGFLIALVGLYQLQVVPISTLHHEYDHEQAVHADLASLNTQIVRAGTDGQPAASTVAVGQDYPPSLLFRTPAALSGRLSARSAGSVSVSNVRVTDGAHRSPASGRYGPYETETLSYTPQYVQYADAPETVLSNGQVVDQYASGKTVRVSGTPFVSGTQVTLVTLTGSPGKATGLSQTVSAVPASAATESISVTNTTGGPVTVRVPTVRSQSSWDAALAEQKKNGHVVSDTVENGVLTVTLERGVTYDLRLARVDLGGSGNASEPGQSVAVVSGGARSVPPSGTQRVVVEVHDRFGNPVSGEHVQANTPDGFAGTVRSGDAISGSRTVAVTDEHGQASFVVKASGSDIVNTGSVTYTIQSS